MCKSIRLILLFLLSSGVVFAIGESKPSGLMTDLIAHTERVYENGFLSDLSVSRIGRTANQIQYVEIASSRPSFGWIVPSMGEETVQKAFQLMVFATPETARTGENPVWDSGLIDSDRSVGVLYDGNALLPGCVYCWKVRVVAVGGEESAWSDVKEFKLADVLSEYSAAGYPVVKRVELADVAVPVAADTRFFDFAKAAFGQLVLTATSRREGDTLRVHLGERSENGRINRHPGGTIRYRVCSLPLTKGTATYRITITSDERNTGAAAVLMPSAIGEVLPFRYCEVEGNADVLETVHLMRESAHYPFDDTASAFLCSNDTLNQLWELSKYTIKATSFLGIYVDGDRERIPYEADVLINQLGHYGTDREYTMARRSHEYLLHHPTWPTEWILQAILIAWQEYMYTGDSRSLTKYYAVLKARTLLALKAENGLISTKTGLQTPEFRSSIGFNDEIRDIVDWPHTGILGLNKQEGGEADGYVFTDFNTVVNAFHYEALKRMGDIAVLAGRPEDAGYFAEESKRVKEAFNKTFLHPEKGYYVDGEATEHASLHANLFPLAFGLVPEKNKARVLAFIRSRGMACSVYGAQFLLDALYDAANADYALTLLTKTDDRSWFNMIRAGSTISMEAWDDKYKPNQDWNHAWGAAPANIIPRKLMGVEPLTAGFERIRIKPQPATLEWAKATIPTIRGTVSVDVENRADCYILRLSIPANTKADVYLPLPQKKHTFTKNGVPQKGIKVKGEQFLYAGQLGAGDYTLRLDR